jgi:hypothetical protein
MKFSARRSLGLVFAGLAVGIAMRTAVTGGQPVPKPSRGDFMRQKLTISKHVLEGLALERFALIEDHARALKRLSEAAEWDFPSVPTDSDFALFTTEFRRNTDELFKQAKERNIDGATLAYLKLTIDCVECHGLIRRATK